MERRFDGRGRRRGSAMIGATFVVTMVAALSLCYLRVVSSASREQVQAIDDRMAFYMAEAGISEASSALASGGSGAVGTPELPAVLANGMFWVEVSDAGDGLVRLESIGLCGGGRRAIEVVVEPGGIAPASLGVFGDEEVRIEDGSAVDSYDSTAPEEPTGGGGGTPIGMDPSPDTTPEETPPVGVVGSNGDIVLGTEASIDGDALPGTDGVVDLGLDSQVTGSSTPRAVALRLPDVTVPEATTQGALAVETGQSVTLPAGVVRYDAVTIAERSQLVVDGPTALVVDTLTVDAGGFLTLDGGGGTVDVYVLESLSVPAGATLQTTSELPGSVTVHLLFSEPEDPLAAAPLELEGQGAFYGFLYAPSVALSIPATLEVFGGVAAKRLTLAPGAAVHIDRHMVEAAAVAGEMPRIVSWALEELPLANSLVKTRIDPFSLMRLRNLLAPICRDAHDLPANAHTLPEYDATMTSSSDNLGRGTMMSGGYDIDGTVTFTSP